MKISPHKQWASRVRATPVGGSLWSSEHSQGTFDLGFGLDVAEVGCHAWSVSDVVEAQLAHQRAVLQQQGQGLPNAPRGPQHCHLGIVLCKRDSKHIKELSWQLPPPPPSSDLGDFTTLSLLLVLFLNFLLSTVQP